jgi:predicted transglutaminase-like cysteine proteinase
MPRDPARTTATFALFGLLILSTPAAAIPRCGPIQLDVLRLEPPPTQYAGFCSVYPGACALTGEPVLDWTEELHAVLERVNAEVNAEIEFVSDPDNHGKEEVWSLPVDCRGDCEDFALEKRRRLTDEEGLPRAAFTMGIAFHEVQFFPHAILFAETSRGTWVLDNLHDELLCWDALPYRYTRRERPDGDWERFVIR